MPVGEAFLSAFLPVLFDRLASKQVVDIIRGHGIENELKRLKKTLTNVVAVLNDTEDKQSKNKAVEEWLAELKDATYDAEDVLDEFATEALQWKLEKDSQTGSNQVWSLISASLNPYIVGIESKIKAITKRFDELAKERFDLGLEEVVAGSSSRKLRETSSMVDESCVYGMGDDKEQIVELLLKDYPGCDNKISVIPIVGMGGVGKTTLARIVYNDQRLDRHFHLKAWACVSEEFDVKRLTKSILKSVTSETSDCDNLNQVQLKLKEALIGKKFLLVLDDVWSKKYGDWDILQNPFRVGAPGSKIVVTTRIKDVALMMGTVDNHYMKHLSDNDCWSVFAQHAFGSRNIDTKPNLVVIGKKIVEKCRGLPLAAKTLGGLLCSKLEEDEWEDILNRKIWDLPEEENDILPALLLSYHHLPSYLKRCFTYCSILPKNYEFEEMELVLLWMAEGFLQPNGRKQIEDLGVEYFRDLLSSSFFQPSSSNKSRFVMHDLIIDLAQWVAGETCFRLEDKLEGEEECIISRRARHSSYIGSIYDGVKKFEAFNGVECLRTFLPLMTPKRSYLTNNVPHDVLLKFRCLRVLSLAGYRITELPKSIDGLKHLRYLNLSSTKIRRLPESISTIYNLQTLILKDCFRLKKLPTAMRNLINLRFLDITNADSIKGMPPSVGKLMSLRNLSNFIVGKDSGSRLKELMNLKCLRGTLCISSLENVTDARDAWEANLKDKKDLDVLIIEWSSEFNDSRNEGVEEYMLDMLKPHKKLKELSMKCYGGIRLSNWVADPSFANIVLLRLENCVKCTSLPPLGQLFSLKDLCIKGMNKVSSVGLEFYGEGCPNPFPSLETLSFVDMKEWKDWFPYRVDRQVEVLSSLRKLSVESCPKLQGQLPDHLPSLEALIICRCRQLEVSISSLPKLCKLDIVECQEVVQGSMVSLTSLKFMGLSNISKSLWQNEARLIWNLTSLCHLKIGGCPEFVSLVAEEHGAEQKQQQQQQQEQGELWMPCRLESLGLHQCTNLEKLQGFHTLTSLQKLTIQECPRLMSSLESGLPSMLRELTILHCSALTSLPWTVMHCSKYASLEYLRIERCHSITSIARGHLPSTLKKLEIRNCKNLQSLVDEEEGSTSTTTTSFCDKSSSISSNASLLELLSIYECPSLKSISTRGELPMMLKYLHVQSCPKLESVAESLCNNTFLEHLSIYKSPSLKSISSRGEFPVMLKRLDIWECPELESLAERLHNYTSLESIRIRDCERFKSLLEGLCNLSHLSSISMQSCPSLVSFPEGGLPANNLSDLSVFNCEKLEALPHHMHNLTSLQKLTIISCSCIVSFPEEGLPTNLTSLWITDLKICKALFEWGLHRLTSLRQLEIAGGCTDLVSFPEKDKGMILPSSLTRLSIVGFPNLEYLSSKGFQNLTSLEYLDISNCPKLKSFPEEGLPLSLLQLDINGCPLLKQRCTINHGQDWPKIAQIPCVYIDYKFIFDQEY